MGPGCDASFTLSSRNQISELKYVKVSDVSLKTQISRLPGVRRLWRKLTQGPGPSAYHTPILTAEEANELIFTLLISPAPFLVARIGSNELRSLRHYLMRRCGRKRPTPYPSSTLARMEGGPGFFGATDHSLDRFAREYLEALQQVDALGVWFNPGENDVISGYCQRAELMMLADIEPYFHQNPWSRALTGRRVLVIHPFAQSIKENYENSREYLFEDGAVLPPFDLSVIKAVQSIAGEPTTFRSWFDALAYMKREMDATSFDICIVGAGAYGLPLAAHAKKSGLQAIHMGGATQILFGIRGRRWDAHAIISKLYNEHWIRPKPSEVPRNFKSVEDGCYW